MICDGELIPKVIISDSLDNGHCHHKKNLIVSIVQFFLVRS